MTTYGYARVSTCGQELDLQLAQLRASGCERFFCEKESGVKDERRELQRMLRRLKADDVVIVSALDRLTRGGPYKTLSILNDITSRGAAYKSLAEPWADTTHELGEVLAALVGYIARKTREDIIRRTTAGRERARANGVKFGRKPKLSPCERQAVCERLAAGETQRMVALAYRVSASTISRLGQSGLVRTVMFSLQHESEIAEVCRVVSQVKNRPAKRPTRRPTFRPTKNRSLC